MSRTLLTLVCQHSRSRPTRDPSGFTSPLRSRGRWHVVLTSVFHERIRARTERMCQPSFVLLLLEVTLRSTFQRSRGIIVKRLSPFSLERPGFTSGSPPARPSLSLAALPHQSLATLTQYCRSTAFHSIVYCAPYASLRSWSGDHPEGPRCSRPTYKEKFLINSNYCNYLPVYLPNHFMTHHSSLIT